MDRGKPSQARGGKSKTPQFPSDIFALGAKTARNESGDSKRSGPVPLGSKHSGPVPVSKLGAMADRKRDLVRTEPSTSSSILPVKKPKISSPTISDYWESLAIDIDPVDLLPTFLDAHSHHSDKVVSNVTTGLLCGALKLLKVQRPRPDSILWLSLMHLASQYPYQFTQDSINQALCSLLRKDALKNKNSSSTILAANIFFEAYKETKRWPDSFVKLYLEDAANERIWVDHELCHGFVENILTCVNTKPLPNMETIEDNIVDAVSSSYRKSTSNVNVINRYTYNQEHVETLVLETVKEHLNRRQALDSVTKNLLKLLTSTCGIAEIRLLVIPKLDAWLQNAKLMKPAQDLLMSVCINTTTHTQRDIEVISGLVKIRFKPKVLGGYYVTCIKPWRSRVLLSLMLILKVIDLLFNLSTYHHPENIDLPPGFVPPRLAIANMYWKTWLILLIYCAHNPSTFGTYCWDKFPTLKTLIEMTITSNFTSVHICEDLQLLALEKQSIIEFEAHLAAATSKVPITEQSSLLLSQLISLDPSGPVRKPPQVVIEQLKADVPKLHLRRLLYRSRAPDFLLDIIKRQEPSQSMSWLADLVHSSEGSLNHLPVQCLCGFLLSGLKLLLNRDQTVIHSDEDDDEDDVKMTPAAPVINLHENKTQAVSGLKLLLNRDQTVIHSDEDDDEDDVKMTPAAPVINLHENKTQAVSGLKLLLNRDQTVIHSDEDDDEDDVKMTPAAPVVQETDWLLVQLPKIPHFAHARAKIMVALRQACQVENDPHLVITYLVFLSKFGIVGANLSELTELAQDIANLIVERSTIMTAILPSLTDGDCREYNVALDAMLNIIYKYFNEAFLVDTSEEALLIPDWLKLRMIRSKVPRLVDAALEDLEPAQLLQGRRTTNQANLAFLVDTSEEALLIPDWLKLRMIRSKVPRLVDAALEDLEPAQLLLFIQSFGIPVASMSILLETLDQAVSEDPATVESAVMDKSYMVQLVEVQHQRGATGGTLFASIIGKQLPPASPLGEDMPSPAPNDNSVTDVEMRSVPSESKDYASVTPSQIIQLLTCPDMHMSSLKRLCEELNATKAKNESTPFVKQVLFELMTHSMSKQQCYHLVDGMLRNIKNATMVLRMLTAASVRDVIASLSMSVKNIKDNLVKTHKVHSSPLLLIIDDFFKRNKQVLSKKKKGVKVQMKGELLDWLIQIEPEPISLTCNPSKQAQISRIFSREEHKHSTYVLTLLIHHASWTTLHQCVQILLCAGQYSTCNPRTVLDFLQALNFNPKFWQGRERNIPKHKENLYDDVLSLSEDQVLTELPRDFEMKDRMYAALVDLICMCCFLSVATYVRGDLRIPDKAQRSVAQYCTTVLDKMSHTIITALTCVELPRTKNHQLESALRKLSSKHPILVLRQLPLIANSLLERLVQLLQPHIFHKVYKDSLHCIINTYTELFLQHGFLKEVSAMLPKFISFIQNYVSNDAETANSYIQVYKDSLHCIINTYTELFLQHGFLKEVSAMLPKFISFIQNYVSNDAETANKKIPSSHLILRLSSIVYNPHQMYRLESAPIDDEKYEAQMFSDCYVTIHSFNEDDHYIVDVTDDVREMRRDENQDLLTEIKQNELERFTSCPAVLERLFPSFVSLLSHESSTVRTTALSLLVTYVRHDPACVSTLVPSLLNTLNAASSPEVVASLCERLPDIIVFAQEDALPILSKLFSLNMWMNCNTLPSIMRCISTLSLQSGC
ncbi:integrator complex subunit 1 [Diaphorina citri]|uniref:Integrator complex subunit 1 n=1 Tax=Diaphorina citri TaxID=121845 RepID=A0A3Q0IR95_DIACI|nr:integrator complex subunit 1 [Diaphorina citri]